MSTLSPPQALIPESYVMMLTPHALNALILSTVKDPRAKRTTDGHIASP
jgi:hypothetical protein